MVTSSPTRASSRAGSDENNPTSDLDLVSDTEDTTVASHCIKDDFLSFHNTFLQMSKEKVQQRPGVGARVPCLGILLVLLGVTVFQCGSVLAKKMTLHPVTMLLFRD